MSAGQSPEQQAFAALNIGHVIAAHGPVFSTTRAGDLVTGCAHPRCDGALFAHWSGYAQHLGTIIVETGEQMRGRT